MALWVESVGRCWGAAHGVVALVDDERRFRVTVTIGPTELSTLVAITGTSELRRGLGDGRILGVYLVEGPIHAPIGVVLAVDRLGRRAHVCRVAEAVRQAAATGLPLWVSDDAVARWGTRVATIRRTPGVMRPPAVHRLIAGDRRTLDTP
jgi:hypothetical protein